MGYISLIIVSLISCWLLLFKLSFCVTCQSGQDCLQINGLDSGTLNCAEGYQCIAKCTGSETCNRAIFNAETATNFSVTCTGNEACKNGIEINCPLPPYHITGLITCHWHAASGSTSGDAANVCSPEGYNSFKCTGTQCNIIMSCGANCELRGTTCNTYTLPSLATDTTIDPTSYPTVFPTKQPTTSDPTFNPSSFPSLSPTNEQPTTLKPTNIPTSEPTNDPIINPTIDPTSNPSMKPTLLPNTELPSSSPTTSEPSNQPTVAPTPRPSNPTIQSTLSPTISPIFGSDGQIQERPTADSGQDNSTIPTDVEIYIYIALAIGILILCCAVMNVYFCYNQQKLKKQMLEVAQKRKELTNESIDKKKEKKVKKKKKKKKESR